MDRRILSWDTIHILCKGNLTNLVGGSCCHSCMSVRLMILRRRPTMRALGEAVMSLTVGSQQWPCVWLEVGQVMQAAP